MANSKTAFDLDFTGVETSLMIPEGTHTVKVSNAEFTKASTGSDQLVITYKNNDGATIRAWYTLTPQALWKLKQVLIALGIPCEGKIHLEARQLIGKTCRITVEADENNEKYRNVTDVQPLGGEAPIVGFNGPAAPQEAYAQQAPAPAPQVAPQPVAPAPVQTAQQPIGNLPPWMQNAQASTPAPAPAGNLPPWMR